MLENNNKKHERVTKRHWNTCRDTNTHYIIPTLRKRGESRSPHSDGGQQSLGHVSDDDADEEDDGLQPAVAQDDWQDEEGDAQEHGHAGDDLDEVLDLLGDGRLSGLQAGGQSGNTAHDGSIPGANHNPTSGTWQEKTTELSWYYFIVRRKSEKMCDFCYFKLQYLVVVFVVVHKIQHLVRSFALKLMFLLLGKWNPLFCLTNDKIILMIYNI